MTQTITCIGEPLAEISKSRGLNIGFGGDTLNTAIYCARGVAECDIDVRYVTAIGTDVVSDELLELLRTEGIDASYVFRNPTRQIGIYAIRNDSAGERSFHYWRNNSAARLLFSSDAAPELAAIASSDIVYLSGITLAILNQDARDRLWNAISEARKSGTQIAFDSNYRPALWETKQAAQKEISRFWALTDIALPTIDDEIVLFGEAHQAAIIDRIQSLGACSGALKCGSSGPIVFQRVQSTESFAEAERVVDTTGAGDSFNGAYIGATARGMSSNKAAMIAHNLAKQVVGYSGAVLPKE